MRVLVIGGADGLLEAIDASDARVRAVDALEDASAALTGYWPDVVVLMCDWTAQVASWVERNVSRAGIRAVVVGRAVHARSRGVAYLAEGAPDEDVVAALGAKGARVA